MVRRGDMVQCEYREMGGGLVKILTTDIGRRRLLGTGTGGEAIVGLLDDDELGRVWTRHSAAYLSQGLPLQQLIAQAHAGCRRAGHRGHRGGLPHRRPWHGGTFDRHIRRPASARSGSRR